jgi:hypothetical protein
MPPLRSCELLSLSAALCAGCFAPFPHDRHDLVDFRIVGVQVSDSALEPGEPFTAKALVYGGDGFYHDALPSLDWSLGDQRAEGPEVSLDAPSAVGEHTLELVATHADGLLVEIAWLPLAVEAAAGTREPPSLGPVRRAVVPLDASDGAEALALEARELLIAQDSAVVGLGEAARLVVPVQGELEDLRARWMTAGARGTFLELDTTATDWLPATVLVDGDEIEVDQHLEPGLVGVAVLVMDGAGANAWAFADLAYRAEPSQTEGTDAWSESDGRLLALDVRATTELVEVTLRRDDASAWGVAFEDASPHRPPFGQLSPFGTGDLPCEHPLPLRGPFRLDWLAEGFCSREAVIGRRVILRVRHPAHTWGEP